MRSYNLEFISDEDIFTHVKETVEKYRFKIDLKKFNKNMSWLQVNAIVLKGYVKLCQKF